MDKCNLSYINYKSINYKSIHSSSHLFIISYVNICSDYYYYYYVSICYHGCLQQDDAIHKFVRKIIVLPFLPAQHIQSMFVRIKYLVPRNVKICEFINYVCQPWIEHLVFVSHCWTVYNIKVCFSHNSLGLFWHGSVYFTTRP